jgi:hypothetical protein
MPTATTRVHQLEGQLRQLRADYNMALLQLAGVHATLLQCARHSEECYDAEGESTSSLCSCGLAEALHVLQSLARIS